MVMASADAFPKDSEDANADICKHCQFTEDYKHLSLGHIKCTFHRPYTGTKYWEPDNCPQCQEMIAKIRAESGAARRIQLKQIKTFLDLAKQKIEHKDPHKSWEYLPIYEYTFTRKNVYQPQQGSRQSGAVSYKMADIADSVTIPEEDTGVEIDQSPPQSTLPTKCSTSNCIMKDDDAQCQDPIHQEVMDIEYISTRDNKTSRVGHRQEPSDDHHQEKEV